MNPFKHRLAQFLQSLESLTVDVIYDRRQDRLARAYGCFLKTLSFIFEGIARLRLWLYRQHIMRPAHLGCLTIIVGNLTVGGTGKTPVVERLARALHQRGRTVAILSRGYKSKKEPFWKKWWRLLLHQPPAPPRVVSDGKQVLLDSETAGDEPYMLARNLPGVMVITDKDRVKAGNYAIEKYGADTLILDDGFQYFRLKDQLQLLLVDKTNPFGNGSLLPRGILREPISHLKRASYVFLTKSDGEPDPELEALIRKHRPQTDFIECTHKPQYLADVFTGERQPLEWLKGKRVLALSGIAVPESFEKFLIDHGADIGDRQRFMDHHRFSDEELQRIYQRAADGTFDALLTTEKDAVRLPVHLKPAVPCYYLRVEIRILSGVADFDEAVSRICFPKKKIPTTRPPFAKPGQAFE